MEFLVPSVLSSELTLLLLSFYILYTTRFPLTSHYVCVFPSLFVVVSSSVRCLELPDTSVTVVKKKGLLT